LTEAVRDFEKVAEEIPLGVANVGSVQPDVALVEKPVELQPHSVIRARRVSFEPGAVEHWSFDVDKVDVVSPVAGNVNYWPIGIVEIFEWEDPAEVLVGDLCPPRSGQLHARRRYRASPGSDQCSAARSVIVDR
jgi:hypothetical protein